MGISSASLLPRTTILGEDSANCRENAPDTPRDENVTRLYLIPHNVAVFIYVTVWLVYRLLYVMISRDGGRTV